MWWLVPTYGNHTRAALLHDAFIVDEGEPPIPRAAADRLLLTALREPGQKTGVFRHWLMWAAVSAFGTAGKLRGAVFSAHVLAVWALLVGALVWAQGSTIWSWGPAIWRNDWNLWGPFSSVPDWTWNVVAIVIGSVMVISALLTLLGGAWRAGVNRTGGWVSPIAVIGAIIGVFLRLEWPWWLELEMVTEPDRV
jgi:hypothetical protein